MLLFAATIAAATAQPAVPQRQAKASVRIVRAEPLHFRQIERLRPELLRSTTIRSPDGKAEPARLVEYQ